MSWQTIRCEPAACLHPSVDAIKMRALVATNNPFETR